jgi:hypothetical protein|tara:strand:+ start:137 stop:457 length:321 start_codon:yes stop_codon:yes gene_type:complete
MKTKRDINIFSLNNGIIRVAKMFEEQGLNLDAVFIEDTGCNWKGSKYDKELNIHGSDMFRKGLTTVYVTSKDDTKYYMAWYKLNSYNEFKFENWTLSAEKTEYRNV